jgi:hypothetical protein
VLAAYVTAGVNQLQSVAGRTLTSLQVPPDLSHIFLIGVRAERDCALKAETAVPAVHYDCVRLGVTTYQAGTSVLFGPGSY